MAEIWLLYRDNGFKNQILAFSSLHKLDFYAVITIQKSDFGYLSPFLRTKSSKFSLKNEPKSLVFLFLVSDY